MRFIGTLFIFLLISCGKKSTDKLTIAAASSMQYVLTDLIPLFEAETATSCTVITGSSGKLTAQIEAGAPFDLFLSANETYPEYLVSKLELTTLPQNFGKGTLVLFTGYPTIALKLDVLKQEKITKIAIPNPEIAPYGMAARQVLERTGLYLKISNKLVQGENIGQTNQFIDSGAAQIGFSSLSTIRAKELNSKAIYWSIVPDSLYDPINHSGLIITTTKKQQEKARLFMSFLTSAAAKQILEKHGYTIVN